MLLPDNEVRKRRHTTINEFVREFDSFNKVVDDVKEEATVINGVYAIVCFIIIVVLCVGQIQDYLCNDDVFYKFDVDVSYDERPTLTFDILIAMPCNSLSIFAVSQASGSNNAENVAKEPSRFEMDDNERKLWDRLRKAQQQQFEPGTRFKALSDMSFVSSYVEENLRSIADDKVAEEVNEIQRRRESGPLKKGPSPGEPQIVMLVGNGMGMFQLIKENTNPTEGTACRVHGSIPVLKGDGDKLVVSPTNVINLPAFFGVAELGSESTTNFSHRIEIFHFGPPIRGLVTPLAGTEKISQSGRSMYKYFIKIVPTRIFNRFGSSTLTYQYSVTSMQRDSTESGFLSSGIAFTYEFTAYVVEVWPKQISFVQFVLRMCCVIGGVFTTSVILHSLLNKISVIFAKTRV